jgi:RNA polymerase sigma-70 factor (ECF subfamily)
VSRAEHYAAYEALLKRYLGPLQRLAYAYTREPSARDDLFQEIALALWTALPLFRGDASERTWLYRVAHNTAIRFTTRRLRRTRYEQPDDGMVEAASPTNPERSAIDSQQRARLWAAVRTLPLPDRRLVMLHLEGLSAAEIESVIGLSAGNVATRLTRLRRKLAATIGREQER